MKSAIINISLIILLILGFLVRLYKFDRPLADWHSWRQSDTASVALEYLKHGIDLLHPTYQDLSSIPSGKSNPFGYRMVEFPLINALVALLTRYANPSYLDIHVMYRLVNILLSLLSAWLIYLIIKSEESTGVALLSLFFFLFLPYNIFYSTSILPEVAMTTSTLAATYFALRFAKSRQISMLFLCGVLSATALLIKPVAIFFLIGAFPLMIRGISQLNLRFYQKNLVLLLTAILVVTPLLLWRLWINQFPEGIPASTWLLNGNSIRFKGAFFQWIFADRIGRLILGFWGLILFGLGLVIKKKTSIVTQWALGSLVYVFVFATGNVQHDYYQIPLIPVIAILTAYGTRFLLGNHIFDQTKSQLLAIVAVSFTLMFGWYHVRGFFNINNPSIVIAGQAVDRLTSTDAKIIAPYQGDTAFLYQTHRTGWPIGGSIDEFIKEGATHYVSINKDDEVTALRALYPVLIETSDYIIFELKR